VNFLLTLRLLGLLTLLLAVCMTSCLFWAWLDDDRASLTAFGLSIAGGLALSFVLLYAGRSSRGDVMGQREGLMVVTGSWIVAGLVGALPFYLSGAIPGPVDALFESISGFTTTGASILVNIQELPRAILFWRSLIQWLGGMGIVVLFVAVLPGLGIGGRFLYRQEVPGPAKAGLRPHVRDTASMLWKIYLGLSSAETLLLHLAGMDLFEAMCHTFTTMATGGYSTRNASIGAFDSFGIQAIFIIFMFAAGVNFALYANIWRGGGRWSGTYGLRTVLRDPELRFYVGLLVVATFLLSAVLMGQTSLTPAESFQKASFQAVSMQTTTGFATADFDAWPGFCRLLLVLLMFVGGCAGSTGGSMKVIRYMIMGKLAAVQVRRFFRPRQVSSVRVGREVVDEGLQRSIAGFFVLFLSTWVAVALALALMGSDLVTSVSASIACLGNIGPGLAQVGPAQNYFFFSAPAKLLLAAAMIIGRLEVYTVVGLLSRSFWKP
jgi:trk system potassium uptake protein TrkH